MSMKTMYELKDMLCDELDEIVGTGHITASDLDTVHKLTDTIKNIHKIEAMEEEGYSYDGEWGASGTYSNGRHYVRGHYSNAGERAMMSDKIDEMMRNNSMSSADRSTLKRARDMIRR